jgi:hypothetical protein
MKGWIAFRAVYNEDGMERGSVLKKGIRIEGEDSCRDLPSLLAFILSLIHVAYPRTMQPSSARRRACSHARADSPASTVPPVLPS